MSPPVVSIKTTKGTVRSTDIPSRQRHEGKTMPVALKKDDTTRITWGRGGGTVLGGGGTEGS
jgi:hypothetical protein